LALWYVKRNLECQAFNSRDEIEETIARIRDNLTFDDVQSVFQNWMSRLAWVIGKGREYVHKYKRN
jgi:hypothetical protein